MIPLAGKKLGILLAAAPEQANFTHALKLTEHALARRAMVYLYLIDQALEGLENSNLTALAANGAKVFACSLGPNDTTPPNITRSGLGTVSDLIASTDRFVSFT